MSLHTILFQCSFSQLALLMVVKYQRVIIITPKYLCITTYFTQEKCHRHFRENRLKYKDHVYYYRHQVFSIVQCCYICACACVTKQRGSKLYYYACPVLLVEVRKERSFLFFLLIAVFIVNFQVNTVVSRDYISYGLTPLLAFIFCRVGATCSSRNFF